MLVVCAVVARSLRLFSCCSLPALVEPVGEPDCMSTTICP